MNYQRFRHAGLAVVGLALACWVALVAAPASQAAPKSTGVTGRIVTQDAAIASNVSVSAVASCNPGEIVTGGGYDLAGSTQVDANFPVASTSTTPPGWKVDAYSPAGTGAFTVFAVCVPGTGE